MKREFIFFVCTSLLLINPAAAQDEIEARDINGDPECYENVDIVYELPNNEVEVTVFRDYCGDRRHFEGRENDFLAATNVVRQSEGIFHIYSRAGSYLVEAYYYSAYDEAHVTVTSANLILPDERLNIMREILITSLINVFQDPDDSLRQKIDQLQIVDRTES